MPAAIHFHLRQDWRELKRGRPGHRFQDRYERARKEEKKDGLAKRVLLVAVGIVALVLGGFFAVFPGPAIPFFFAGGALLASESRPIARAMDWLEVRGRRIFEWGMKHWRRLPGAARVALIALSACASGGALYLAIRWWRD